MSIISILQILFREERTRLMLAAKTDVHLMMDTFTKTKSKLYKYRRARFPKNPKIYI